MRLFNLKIWINVFLDNFRWGLVSHRNQLISMQKLRHKHYSKLITTRNNVNIQFHDQEESKLNSTINVNRGTHTLRLHEIIKSPFNSFMTGGSLSYRNQSIDLQSKSFDWFLYDNGLRHERVNKNNVATIKNK